jgi:hypothetical protein
VQVGAVYSRFLTPRITLDASAAYTYRTQREGFKVGDLLELDAAVTYRLTENLAAVPRFSVYGEVSGLWLGEDRDHGRRDFNSGGTTVYLSAGVWAQLTENVVLTVGPAVPVFQDFNGDQVPARVRGIVSMTVSF